MGDPKKSKKRYSKPGHPWQTQRIEEEAKLMEEYALKNKRELWKANSFIKRFKYKTKQIMASSSAQAKLEEKQVLGKLVKLKLVHSEAKIEDVLDLPVTAVLERRLQTVVYKKGLAKTPRQARQFITHGHISVKGVRMNIPSYVVPYLDEEQINFSQSSSLKDEEHPERKIEKPEQKIEKKPKKENAVEEESKIKREVKKEVKPEVKKEVKEEMIAKVQ